ncbi:DUF6988 family protein [Lysobacter niastensis]|uniref:AbiV family abortive infection protein n=1 Tax=Lysobacter niastensis TaxID=380629 RepID=A0ABS0B2T2_9GAMM|nr:hypothetical protein [Lysobacter niastensis]MBF6022795.1 hypothetical protein [Lysobacter niastensis]
MAKDAEVIAQVEAKAAEAHKLICQIAAVLAALKIDNTKRMFIALSLLVGSLEHARLLTSILSEEAGLSWLPAMTLHRSQIDHLVRGAYFAEPATDAEVAAFYADGTMPQLPKPKGGTRNMHLNEMAEAVQAHYTWDKRFATAIRNRWSPLSGITHGGIEVVNVYLKNGQVGNTDTDFAGLLPTIGDITALAYIVIAVCMRLSPLSQEEISGIVQPLFDAFKDFNGE